MTRLSKSNDDVRKGAWAAEEDEKLRKYVETYGTGHWRSVGKKAGNDLTKKQKKSKQLADLSITWLCFESVR